MASLPERARDATYTALRVVAGAAFTFHGMQKILGWYAQGPRPAIGSQIWCGGIIELVSGTLIALGLFTRCAAFVASGMMAVAYIQFHWKLAFAAGKWLPAINKGELALVYCFLFLFIWVEGGGRISLDARRARRP
ncbi:MAG: DoxX family protein [Polyangiales bacterium]